MTSALRRTAVAAAFLGLAGDSYHLFVLDERSAQATSAGYRLHGLALMLGLVLLVLVAPGLAASRRRLAGVGLPLLTLGTTLVVGDIWAETVVLPGVVAAKAPALLDEDISGAHLAAVIAAYAAFAVGWALLALAALRDRSCARPAAIVLLVGAVIAFLPVGGSYVLLFVGVALVATTARPAGTSDRTDDPTLLHR